MMPETALKHRRLIRTMNIVKNVAQQSCLLTWYGGNIQGDSDIALQFPFLRTWFLFNPVRTIRRVQGAFHFFI